MKLLFLTFDYEIFFADSGTVERSLLQPTSAIASLLKRSNIPATFFVDVIYFKRLTQEDPEKAELVTEQLKNLVANGHRLELHLHPHWLDAIYKSGTWKFPSYHHYRLESLDSGRIKALFMEGVAHIESIAALEVSGYRVRAFRAGGWCLQPFSKLLPAFEETGLRIDSSIGYGMRGTSPTHTFDFTAAPNRNLYRFSEDPLSEDPRGAFIEAAVSTYSCPPLWRVQERLLRFGGNCKAFGDGRGLRPTITNGKWAQFMETIKPRRRFLSLDGCYGQSALKVLDGKEDAVLVSHPKLISNHSLKSLETLISSNRYRFALLTLTELEHKSTQKSKL